MKIDTFVYLMIIIYKLYTILFYWYIKIENFIFCTIIYIIYQYLFNMPAKKSIKSKGKGPKDSKKLSKKSKRSKKTKI